MTPQDAAMWVQLMREVGVASFSIGTFSAKLVEPRKTVSRPAVPIIKRKPEPVTMTALFGEVEDGET